MNNLVSEAIQSMPCGGIHQAGGFSHTLLGGEVTFLNAFKLAVATVLIWLGYLCISLGLDRTLYGRYSARVCGWLVVVGGILMAFAGGGLAVGLGLFGGWTTALHSIGLL